MHRKIILDLMKKDWVFIEDKISENSFDLVNSDYGEICVTFFDLYPLQFRPYTVAIFKDLSASTPIKGWANNNYKSLPKYLEKHKIKNV